MAWNVKSLYTELFNRVPVKRILYLVKKKKKKYKSCVYLYNITVFLNSFSLLPAKSWKILQNFQNKSISKLHVVIIQAGEN